VRELNKLISNLYAAVFVAVLSLAVPALTQANVSEKLSIIKVKNFGHVNDNYYRGAQPNGHDYADLAAIGIHTVINLTNGDGDANEKTLVENVGMKYYQIPMSAHVQPTPAKISEFLRIVNDPASQPVYVHCAGGRHRTGVMTAVYRITQNGWTADQAFKEMKQYQYGPDFLHPEFKSFVYDYYSHLDRTPVMPEQTGGATKTASP
jgi:protein tyrosine/serine phosphatase